MGNYYRQQSIAGLHRKRITGVCIGLHAKLRAGLHTTVYFPPSGPNELVDQLKLFYFEKVGGNDSFLLTEQIIAIVDKLLEYECITPSQHQNMRSMLSTQP